MSNTQLQIAIFPAELFQLAQRGPQDILDVRTPAEFESVHVPGAALDPLDRLDPRQFLEHRGPDGKPLYIICQTGGRALKAIEKFKRAGFNGCVLVEGGTEAWMKAGLPVIRGERRVLPLMRQVQLVVGILSATGAALALVVNPYFAIIPLFIGCGLFFAGLTGMCGMASLLAKMPWNRSATRNLND